MSMGNWVRDAGGLALYAVAPPWRYATRELLVRQASFWGDRLRRLSPREARAAAHELGRTFPDLEGSMKPADWVKRAYRLRMLQELEVLRYPALTPENIGNTVVLKGREHLDEALAGGTGAILMTGHFGASQMMIPGLGHRGYRVHQLSTPPVRWKDMSLDERFGGLWQSGQRRRWELENTLPVQHIDIFGFLRPAIRALEKNEVLGLAFDTGGGRRWIRLPFGDREVRITESPWHLARLTGATLLPTVVIWDERALLHRVVIAPGWPVGTDLHAAAARYLHWFEGIVRENPDHYAYTLLHRWRGRHRDDQPFFVDYSG